MVNEIKKMDAGHFIQGRHNSVLFDERNVHAQCQRCNRFLHGNLVPYYEYMLSRYGAKIIEELKTNDSILKKFTREELMEMKKEFTETTKEYIENN